MFKNKKSRKGILLAGGSGTRMHPMTAHMSKQLLPVFDKPMIFYPLTTLILANIREILVISTPRDLPACKKLLGNGEKFGIKLSYAEQDQPKGIAEALIIGKEFVGDDDVTLILGDNIFYAQGLRDLLFQASNKSTGATIFCYSVKNPEAYGVANFDSKGRAVKLEEKPKIPKSSFAITGLYFYDNMAIRLAEQLKPSARGELEITDLNQLYLKEKKLDVLALSRGTAWLDMGTPEQLLDAANFVRVIEKRQGLKIGCPEETAFNMGFISERQLQKTAEEIGNTPYGNYLQFVARSTVDDAD